MWPATGSIGSFSPRKRSAERASSTISLAEAAAELGGVDAGDERRPIGVGRRVGDAAATGSVDGSPPARTQAL